MFGDNSSKLTRKSQEIWSPKWLIWVTFAFTNGLNSLMIILHVQWGHWCKDLSQPSPDIWQKTSREPIFCNNKCQIWVCKNGTESKSISIFYYQNEKEKIMNPLQLGSIFQSLWMVYLEVELANQQILFCGIVCVVLIFN